MIGAAWHRIRDRLYEAGRTTPEAGPRCAKCGKCKLVPETVGWKCNGCGQWWESLRDNALEPWQ